MKTLGMSMMAACILFVASALRSEEEQDVDSWRIPSSKEDFHLFLLMGQSNMAGGVDMASGDDQPIPYVLKMHHAKKGDEPKWVPGAHPLHPGRPRPNRHGLGISFAKTKERSTI